MRRGCLLEGDAHARRVGDISLEGKCSCLANAVEGGLRTRDPRDRPAVGDECLDHRPAEVARSEDDRAPTAGRACSPGEDFRAHLPESLRPPRVDRIPEIRSLAVARARCGALLLAGALAD